MFLDSFPLQLPENRAARPLREPAAVETGKSRSAWPFIVTDKGFAMPALHQAPRASLVAPSSFVT